MIRFLKTIPRRLTIVIYMVFCLFPVYWMVSMSFEKPVDATSYPPAFVFKPTLENYHSVLSSPEILHYFLNSLIIGLGSVALGVSLGVPAAYILGRYDFKRRRDYSFWILTTRMAPPVAVLLPFFIVFQRIGLLDTRIGLIIVYTSQSLAIIVWVMKGFFGDIPAALEEASMLDGCTHWQAFRRVVLPLAVPGIAATGILAFLFSWNEFLFALVLTERVARTVPVGLYSYLGYEDIRWGELSAGAFVMIIPVVLVVVLFQRQLIRGLTFGAVRG